MNFSEKVVLVAGGTGGLGRSVSEAFAAAGAHVTVTYRRTEELDALVLEVKHPARLAGYKTDVTDAAAVAQMMSTLMERHARIDVLVNSVGGFAGGKKLWESDDATYVRMMDLNVRSGFVLARAVVPVMLKQGSGAIVNVSSRAAEGHAAGAALYAASKAAAVALMNSLAEEVKGSNVRVNSVLPGIIDTPANRQAMPKADFAAWPKPEEIAQVILFLCSDEAKLINGASVPVYGRS